MRKALAVGINNYPDAQLHGCVRDATDFAQLIASNSDGRPNFNVRLETDVMRRRSLRELITGLFSGQNDTALFYFSGHGYINELGGYLLTPDYKNFGDGISMNDILALANASLTTNKIIILDCCHSGAITAPELTYMTSGHISEGVTILTASKQNEAAMEVNGKGVFTNLLLEALKGGAANINGYITPGSLYAYVDQALGPWEQRPVFKTNVSSFISIRDVAPAIDRPILRKLTEYFPSAAEEHPLDSAYEYSNDPQIEHVYVKPYADPHKAAIFSDLQKMYRAGLIEPVGEQHMYWAAMKQKACRLTLLGLHYWRLISENKL